MRWVRNALLGMTIAVGASTLTSCATQPRPTVVVERKSYSSAEAYLQQLLEGGAFKYGEAVSAVKQVAEKAKTLSSQRVSPQREIGNYVPPIVLLEKLYNKGGVLKALAAVGYAELGSGYEGKVYAVLREALESKDEDFKLLAVEAAKTLNTEKAARYVAYLLLKEGRDSPVRSAAVVALLSMDEGYKAVKALIKEDPSRIAAFKDIYALIYFKSSPEDKERLAEEVLQLGRDMVGRASIEAYEAWKELLMETGIAYDFPYSTLNTATYLFSHNPFRESDRKAFDVFVGNLYREVVKGVMDRGFSPLAKKDRRNRPTNMEGPIGDLYRLLDAVALLQNKEADRAYRLVKGRVEDYLKQLELNEKGRPAFTEGLTDGQAAFVASTMALHFRFLTLLGEKAKVQLDRARGRWIIMLPYIEDMPTTWRVSMLEGGNFGVGLFGYAEEVIKRGNAEKALVAAKAVANAAYYADLTATGGLGAIINYVSSSSLEGRVKEKVLNWLGIALGRAIYYGALRSADKVIPAPYGTHIPAGVSVEEQYDLYRTALDRLVESNAHEGALNVLAGILKAEGRESQFPFRDYFAQVAQGLEGRELLTNATARELFLLAVYLGEDNIARAAMESLVRARSWEELSAAFTDLLALTGRREMVAGHVQYETESPLPAMENLKAYLRELSLDPSVPPFVRGTASLLLFYLENGKVIVAQAGVKVYHVGEASVLVNGSDVTVYLYTEDKPPQPVPPAKGGLYALTHSAVMSRYL